MQLTAARDTEVAFDVVDVLDGFATLERRSPTLGGSVPVRVARACMPLLEGNAWGFQIALRGRIELRQRFGRWSVAAFERGDELARLVRASVPVLVGDGTLHGGGPWARRLERGIVDTRGGISLFTGLFVRPRRGVRLRQSSTANRRSFAYEIGEAILDDVDGFCPIVLDVVPRGGVDAIALDGEIATLGVLPGTVTFARLALDDASTIARAHLDFYDAAYFDTKRRGETSRKYRDDIARRPPDEPAAVTTGHVHATIVDAGPSRVELAAPRVLHRAAGPIAATVAGAPPDRLVFRNAVAFAASFDGARVAVEPDAAQLERYASDVRAAWQRYFDRSARPHHDGALLYLTKYFTPHPPGEPHFFVKPCALVATSPGGSTVLDGIAGAGYDVLRGVVRTDGFHATPAVFQLWQPGRSIEVADGAPLLELFPSLRALADARFERAAGGLAAARWGA